MPYVITTKTRGFKEPTMSSDPPKDWLTLSRIAVATLEEARDYAAEEVIEHWASHAGRSVPATNPHLMAAYNMAERGDTVGPLPDGTVIEVERVKWEDLQATDPWFYGAYAEVPASISTTIVDAYNAAQGG